jgi:hypothetical protein
MSEQSFKLKVTMEKKNIIPMATAAFIVAVGLMFLGAVLIDLPPLKVKSPGNYVLAAVSLLFVFLGAIYAYLLAAGKLEHKGRTIAEVRQEAVENIKDRTLLAKIATEDPNPEVREAAQERLQEIAS